MRATTTTLVALTVGALLTACTADAEPAPAVTTSAASPSSTITPPLSEAPPSPSSPVPARPVLPAAATTPDAAGAEAFMRHFWDTVNYAYATGDTEAILAISEQGCEGCTGLKDGVETATSVGATWVDFAWATEQYLSEPPNANGISLVSALMILPENAHVINADGTRSEVAGARVKSFQALTEWHGDSWKAYAIQYPDDDQ